MFALSPPGSCAFGISRTFRILLIVLGLSLQFSCGGDSAPGNVPVVSDPQTFLLPRRIQVSVAPYSSVNDALSDEQNIDWTRDKARARAITVAYAAKELHEHLAMAGVATTISALDTSPDKPALVLTGPSESTSDVLIGMSTLAVDYGILGDQGFAITPAQARVYITANDRIGVLYGVYSLLEQLGFAWYDPEETHVPDTSSLVSPITWQPLRAAPRVDMRGFWTYGDKAIPDDFAVWLARNRFNLGGQVKTSLHYKLGLKGWGGGHELLQQEFSRAGVFEAHPEWYGSLNGTRQPINQSEPYFNPSFASEGAAHYFADRLVERLEHGDLRGVDILNIWPSDNRSNTLFDKSPEALALGNDTDNLLNFYLNLSRRLRAAYAAGQLLRPVVIAGISYFATMEPPSNASVLSQLENENYLHCFYLIDRSWSDYLDADLANRDANRNIMRNLTAWQAVARFNYGVVEYHNLSSYAAVGLSDFPYLAGNYETLIRDRRSLFAYMHPLLRNPGPRRLTNAMLAELAWSDGASAVSTTQMQRVADQTLRNYFQRRYTTHASEWREIYRLMSQSVENAKEMFGIDSLYWLLFQQYIWSDPPYSRRQVADLVPRYRAGGAQSLPGGFPGVATVREVFRGLDESIALQEQAFRMWQAVLDSTLEPDVRRHMEDDVYWFSATASRYRLMAATCDLVAAELLQQDTSESISRMAKEIALLQTSPVTQDTISPVDQRAFLDFHRLTAGMPISTP